MNNLLKYFIWTVGCQMNKADSERLENALSKIGFENSTTPADSDLIVLNSCVVRQGAEDKVVGMLTSLKPLKEKNPETILALMGCMVGPNTKELKQKFPYADIFIQPQNYNPLIQYIENKLNIDTEGCLTQLSAKADVTAYIPIVQGCDKFCSFCIIPYRRGREICRPVKEIILETQYLSERGVKEITLLGQNIDSYGHDLPEKPDLGDLLKELNKIDGIERIRFLTSHPNDMSDHIIESVAELEKVCEHINLPIQAGDNEILNKMRRRYTNEEYRNLIEKIRSTIPNVSISTDIIVGFCGENDTQFQKTIDIIKDIRFDKVHAAAYSIRENTIAMRKMLDNVPLEEKKSRLNQIESIQKQILQEKNDLLCGETFEILVEGKKNNNQYGRNRNDKLIYFDSKENLKGSMTNIKINKSTPWSLHGIKTT
ncbi:MAG: tRNA (N6-isopentenyl adenosine(37)-C2)-methylthiotransferase MiaB [Chloroflexi bacterium]|nr:tRNA (N6-isopentenyl adenosine(37)-C2)-methylthiotransferase MiaB [Chloroflexota bacterium]|tara:strand:+ start:9510 stop:10793 length:1284 start_codon:yes stop_codon:yes gene_type:complete